VRYPPVHLYADLPGRHAKAALEMLLKLLAYVSFLRDAGVGHLQPVEHLTDTSHRPNGIFGVQAQGGTVHRPRQLDDALSTAHRDGTTSEQGMALDAPAHSLN